MSKKILFCELEQNVLTDTTISFLGDTISDSNSGLDFNVGDKIRIAGSRFSANLIDSTVLTASASSITIADTLTTETAGGRIILKRVEYFADTGEYAENSKGETVFFSPYINATTDYEVQTNKSYARILAGRITIATNAMRNNYEDDNLTEFNLFDKQQEFNMFVRFGDLELWESKAIIFGINEQNVILQSRSANPKNNFMLAMADVKKVPGTDTFLQNRTLPKVIGTVKHFYCPLLVESTYTFYSGGTYVKNVYERGQIVQFNNVVTTFTTGSVVQYNGNRYTGASATITTSPTGQSSNNADWTYVSAAAGTETEFIATAFNFNLNGAPTYDITADVIGEGNTLVSFCEQLSGAMETEISTTRTNISFTAPDTISSTEDIFSDFVADDSINKIKGERIKITGSSLNDTGTDQNGYWIVDSVAVDGKSITVKTTASTTIQTEAAGSAITVEEFFALDYSQADETINDVNFQLTNQITCLNLMKEFTELHNHIFLLSGRTCKLFNQTEYGDILVRDSFNLDLNESVQISIKDNIKLFSGYIKERISTNNPPQVVAYDVIVQADSGNDAGRDEQISIKYEEDYTIATAILLKKLNDYILYENLKIRYTIDEDGLDVLLEVGKAVDFTSWLSGRLIVHGFKYSFGKSRIGCEASGIALNTGLTWVS